MKNILPYILSILLPTVLVGCKDDFDGTLEPSLVPNLTTPTEATMSVVFSVFSSDRNWDNADENSTDINISGFGHDQDWNQNGNTDSNGNTVSEFNIEEWESDTNWN